ncbi:MAG: hypothetical protein QMD07_03815 [Thermodesulfovibrionales bacterium]|nr:hypothetical protein [Thermodesulfovibrionales bacterium]
MLEGGGTLIEVMIAMVISLLVFFALMQTALVSIDSNMENNLRDEAANIAAMRMEQARNLRYTQSTDSLVSDATAFTAGELPNCSAALAALINGEVVQRDFRNIAGFTFCTNRTVAVIDTNTRSVTIRVGWRWRNEDYNHNLSTIVRRQSG